MTGNLKRVLSWSELGWALNNVGGFEYAAHVPANALAQRPLAPLLTPADTPRPSAHVSQAADGVYCRW